VQLLDDLLDVADSPSLGVKGKNISANLGVPLMLSDDSRLERAAAEPPLEALVGMAAGERKLKKAMPSLGVQAYHGDLHPGPRDNGRIQRVARLRLGMVCRQVICVVCLVLCQD